MTCVGSRRLRSDGYVPSGRLFFYRFSPFHLGWNTVRDLGGAVGNMAQQVGTILGSPESAAAVGNLITGTGNYAGNFTLEGEIGFSD